MGTSRYTMSEKKIQEWVKEGRGSGAGPDYLPWIRVTDIPSYGYAHRVFGELTGRMHHLLSFLEYQAYLLALLMPGIVDIRESYPLERVETREIAEKLGVRHPRYHNSKIDLVMTTDFLLTLICRGVTRYEAWSIKLSSELDDKNTLDWFLIQRMYHGRHDTPCYILTEKEFPSVLLKNAERIRFASNLESHPSFSVDKARQLQARLLELLTKQCTSTYCKFCSEMDNFLGLAKGDTHFLLHNLMGAHVIRYDLSKPWDVDRQLDELHIDHEAFNKLVQSDSSGCNENYQFV